MFKQNMFKQNYRVGVPLISTCIRTLELLANERFLTVAGLKTCTIRAFRNEENLGNPT